MFVPEKIEKFKLIIKILSDKNCPKKICPKKRLPQTCMYYRESMLGKYVIKNLSSDVSDPPRKLKPQFEGVSLQGQVEERVVPANYY